MCDKMKVILASILVGLGTIQAVGPDYFEEVFQDYISFYYLKPEPEKAGEMLKNLFRSDMLDEDGRCDSHCRDLIAYQFGRIGQLETSVVSGYLRLFEGANHHQRILLLRIFELCSNDEVRGYLRSELKQGRFSKEVDYIDRILRGQLSPAFKPLTRPIQEADDLDFLWVEFMTTGDPNAVTKVISAIELSKDANQALILTAGAAKWSLKANCVEHERVLEICKEQIRHVSESLKAELQEIVSKAKSSDEKQLGQEHEKELLQEQVNKLRKMDNVSRRGKIDAFFRLGDIFATEGNNKSAITLYEEGLRTDSWRLEYQLKISQLYKDSGLKEQAAASAGIVYNYAEDEQLIQESESLLKELGKVPLEDKTPEEDKVAEHVQIILVPMGPVNMRLLEEIKTDLENELCIKFEISERRLELGEIDQDYIYRRVSKMAELFDERLPKQITQELRGELNKEQKDWESIDTKIEYLRRLMLSIGAPSEDINETVAALEAEKGTGQYDANRLRTVLEKELAVTQTGCIEGYLGITGADIYAKDFNFLFGWARRGYGVMSYHRFTADFNNDRPNRVRLRKRAVKQAISSSLFILGIPRCTDPTCARAYPHDLEEHDRKDTKLCPWCRKQLDLFLESAGRGNTTNE